MTPAKDQMLHWVMRLAIANKTHISQLMGITEQNAYKQMRHIVDNLLVKPIVVSRLELAPPDADRTEYVSGRAPNLWQVTPEGAAYLCRLRLITRAEAAGLVDFTKRRLIAHEVETTDVQVWLERLARQDGVSLETWKRGKFAEVPKVVYPDAWFLLRLPSGTLAGFVEVDRGTETNPVKWDDKFDDYRKLLSGDQLYALTGRKTARIIVTTPSAKRRDRIATALSGLYPGSGMSDNRFWIIELKQLLSVNGQGLPGTFDLSAPLWRVPGHDELLPFI